MFYSCSAISKVTLTSGLICIGDSMFQMLTGTGKASIKEITIPSTVTSMGTDAFYRCSGITVVILTNGLTLIGEYMFHMSVSPTLLATVTIPSTITGSNIYTLSI